MAFESLTSESYIPQIWPSFLQGYPYEAKYHNIGQLMTPYKGKYMGQGGDYGPPQKTRYYTFQNSNYPYVMDKDFRAASYLPTEGCCYKRPGYFPCYESKYHDVFVPPNYFAPDTRWPTGHEPSRDYSIDDIPIPSGGYGDIRDINIPSGRNGPVPSGKNINIPSGKNVPVREGYGTNELGALTRLVNTYPVLHHANDYPPFDRYY